MVRSLYAGISGLRSHQVALDVTGNNIANVNTVGFKAGRATFKESMAQMLQGPSRPAGNQGGTNPLQIGLGTSIGSIDTMLRQGSLQTTGQITDLALEGRAYFAFSSGNATFYSRNGGLQLDAQGYLVSPTNGFRLQGKQADVNGNYGAKSVIGDIRIPWGEKAPAKATTEISLACNLNSDSEGKGTVTHTNTFLRSASVLNNASVNYLVNFTDPSGNSLVAGNTLTIGSQTLPITATTTLEQLRAAIQTALGANVTVAQAPNGRFEITNNGATATTALTITATGTPASSFSMTVPSAPAATGTAPNLIPGTATTSSLKGNELRNRGVLTNLFDDEGSNLGIKEGDTIKMTHSDSNAAFHFLVARDELTGELPTLEDLRMALEGYLNQITGGNGTPTNSVTVGYDANGGFTVTNNTAVPINGLTLTSDRKVDSSSTISMAFGFEPTIGIGESKSTPPLRIPAHVDDLLRDVFDAKGKALGFENGDPIDITGAVGNKNKSGSLLYSDTLYMLDLVTEMQKTLGLPPTDGTIYERPTVEIKQEDKNGDGIPLGAIVIRGLTETAFAITGLNVRASDDNHQAPSPTNFSTNMTFVEVQPARDTFAHPVPFVVYDEGGAPHNITMTISHTGIPGEWMWEMSTNGDEEIVSGNRGKLIFGIDGTPAAFTFDDGSNGFTFEPKNGASQVSMKINWGAPGSKEGITQFDSATTTAMKDQNGYPMGKLQEISIDEGGEITGVYTNGDNKSLAQIFVAEFNNPAGLLKVGDSMYAMSNNSGYAVMQQPKVGTATKVKPGALEMSNVELETEFTNMITIQRGYQANARVITTSDSLLQELVQLVR